MLVRDKRELLAYLWKLKKDNYVLLSRLQLSTLGTKIQQTNPQMDQMTSGRGRDLSELVAPRTNSFSDFLIVSELGCGIQRGCMGFGRLYQVIFNAFSFYFNKFLRLRLRNLYCLEFFLNVSRPRESMCRRRGPTGCCLRRRLFSKP